ncbi:hypothetical protein ACOSQ4_013964 [Xanthoceras sorbifolium]
MFGSDEDSGTQIRTQVQSIVEGSVSVMVSEYKPVPDVDYLKGLGISAFLGPIILFSSLCVLVIISPRCRKNLFSLSTDHNDKLVKHEGIVPLSLLRERSKMLMFFNLHNS